MQLKTILNYVEPYKSFVYEGARWCGAGKGRTIEVKVRARANSRAICSGCGKKRPGYDRLPERRFEYVPLWQIAVHFVYALRRVKCPQCGIVAERVPWADGKSQQTTTYRWFLAGWARRLSWQEVATIFGTSWDSVYRAVDYAVRWGLAHRDTTGIKAIGVDEIQWRRGHHYLTLVYQIDDGLKRLLWVGQERTEATLWAFFDLLDEKCLRSLKYVCSDMWQPYLQVIAQRLPQAVHVLDRFHIMSMMNKAIDEVRAAEAKRLKRDGYEPVLKHSRWCLLKRRENLTEKQTVKLSELLRYNLQAVRGYLLREDFQRFWQYESPAWAGKFLRQWCQRTMRTKIEPMKKVARSLRQHEELILNWFRAHGTISSGVVEGLNNKVKLTMRKAYGFRAYEAIQLALYHQLGDLPTPKFTHEFC